MEGLDRQGAEPYYSHSIVLALRVISLAIFFFVKHF